LFCFWLGVGVDGDGIGIGRITKRGLFWFGLMLLWVGVVVLVGFAIIGFRVVLWCWVWLVFILICYFLAYQSTYSPYHYHKSQFS
jgi:hypothetical protein